MEITLTTENINLICNSVKKAMERFNDNSVSFTQGGREFFIYFHVYNWWDNENRRHFYVSLNGFKYADYGVLGDKAKIKNRRELITCISSVAGVQPCALRK